MILNKKERMVNAIRGKSLDKFPVSTWISEIFKEKFMARYNLTDQEMEEKLDNHTFFISPEYLGKIKPKDEYADWYDDWEIGWKIPDKEQDIAEINVTNPIANIEDFKKYEFPDPENYSYDKIKNELMRNGDKYLITVYQASGTFFSRLRFLRGFENALMDMITNKKEIEYLLDKILEFQVAKAKICIKLGVHGVNTGDDVAQQQGLIVNPDLWRELIKPRQKKLNELYKNAGLIVIHHCCGDCREIIRDFIEVGVDCLNPIQPEAMPIEYLAEKYGKELCFQGGIGVQKVLPFGSTRDVFREVENCIKVLGRNGKYVIGPSHTMEANIPLENLQAYFEAIEKFNN